MHGHTLPPALLVPALHSPSTSPSAQISRFLGIDVQLVRVSPIKEDVRRCDAPPGEGEKTEWEEESLRLGASGEVTTGFADGYPLLIANEGESLLFSQAWALLMMTPRSNRIVPSRCYFHRRLGSGRTSNRPDRPGTNV